MHKNVLRSLPLVVLIAGFSACGENGSPTQPTPGSCSYSLSASSLSFGASGGAGSVTVTAAAQCTWTASSDRGWMTITSGASGTGDGVVSISLTPNTNTTERTGTLTIASQPVAVREDGQAPCHDRHLTRERLVRQGQRDRDVCGQRWGPVPMVRGEHHRVDRGDVGKHRHG